MKLGPLKPAALPAFELWLFGTLAMAEGYASQVDGLGCYADR